MNLKIEKLIYGGYGLARTGDKVVFIKGGVPGDVVEVDITEEKKSYDIAEIKNVIEPSENRVDNKCEYFGNCGGCQWQNIDYEYQLKAKEQILRESVQRIAGIKDFQVESIVPSPKKYCYRSRVTLHIDTINCKHVLGFKEDKSHKLLPIEKCPISSESISKLIQKISKLLNSYDEKRLPIDRIIVSDMGKIPALCLITKKNVSESDIDKLYYKIKERIQGVDISIDDKEEKSFEFEVLGLKLISSPSIFAQANPIINEQLIETLIKWADLNRNGNVMDLYCGFGNFSIQIARKVKQVLSVDNNKKAIKFAIKNAKLNSIRNCIFEDWDVKKYLQRHKPKENQDLVILDPPRTGSKEIIKSIIDINPKKILYVSCNPTTLARDIKELIKGGYNLKKIQPFDMFPQTFHIESITLLEKGLE